MTWNITWPKRGPWYFFSTLFYNRRNPATLNMDWFYECCDGCVGRSETSYFVSAKRRLSSVPAQYRLLGVWHSSHNHIMTSETRKNVLGLCTAKGRKESKNKALYLAQVRELVGGYVSHIHQWAKWLSNKSSESFTQARSDLYGLRFRIASLQ